MRAVKSVKMKVVREGKGSHRTASGASPRAAMIRGVALESLADAMFTSAPWAARSGGKRGGVREQKEHQMAPWPVLGLHT